MEKFLIEAELKNIFELITACYDKNLLFKKLAGAMDKAVKKLLDDNKIKYPEEFSPEKIVKSYLGDRGDEGTVHDVLYYMFWPQAYKSKEEFEKNPIKSVIEDFKQERESLLDGSEDKLQEQLKEVKEKLQSDPESKDIKDQKKLIEKTLKYKFKKDDEFPFVPFFRDRAKKKIHNVLRQDDSLSLHDTEKEIDKLREKLKDENNPDKAEELKKDIENLERKFEYLREESQKFVEDMLSTKEMDQIAEIQKTLLDKEFKSYQEGLLSFAQSYPSHFKNPKRKPSKIPEPQKDAVVKILKDCFDKDLNLAEDRDEFSKNLKVKEDVLKQAISALKRVIAQFAVKEKEQGNSKLWEKLLRLEGISFADFDPKKVKDPKEHPIRSSWSSIVQETLESRNQSVPKMSLSWIPQDVFETEVKIDMMEVLKKEEEKEKKEEKKVASIIDCFDYLYLLFKKHL